MLATVWKRWDWLNDGLIPLAAAFTYAAWVHPLFAQFLRDPLTGARNPGFTFWLCMGVLLAGAAAGRLAGRSRKSAVGLIIVIVGGLLAILFSLFLSTASGARRVGEVSRPYLAEMLDRVIHGQGGRGTMSEGQVVPVSLIVLMSTTLLWWRGVRIASADHGEAMGAFVVGALALAGLLCLALILPSSHGEQSHPMALRVLSLGTAPMVFLVSIPAAFFCAMLSPLMGGRAITFGQLALVIGLLCLATVLPFGPSFEALLVSVFLFVALGLTTLAMCGASRTLRTQERLTGAHLQLDHYWVKTTLGLVGGILVLGLIIGQIVAPGAIARAFAWLKPIGQFLVRLFLFVVFVLVYLFFGLIESLPTDLWRRPMQLFGRLLRRLSELLIWPLEGKLAGEGVSGSALTLRRALYVVLALTIVAVIAWIFALALRRWRQRAPGQEGIVETRETVFSLDLIRDQLHGLLGGLRRKGPTPLFLELGSAGDSRRIIREIYQTVLARAIELDCPRQRGQTPSAYVRTLVRLCPQEQWALETLTGAYVVARYSATPPTREQVETAQQAFLRIAVALNQA